jgi:hypothetical protein
LLELSIHLATAMYSAWFSQRLVFFAAVKKIAGMARKSEEKKPVNTGERSSLASTQIRCRSTKNTYSLIFKEKTT